MQCPYCKTPNDDEFVFCVNCGRTIRSAPNGAVTAQYNVDELSIPATDEFVKPEIPYEQGGNSPSVLTQFRKPVEIEPPPTQIAHKDWVNYETASKSEAKPAKKRGFLWLGVAALALLVVGGAVFAAILLIRQNLQNEEALPDHLGMFYQNKEKTQVAELRRFELSNALDAKDQLSREDAIPILQEKPDLILYADGNEIPASELKLIALDSLKNDGTMKGVEFQVSPVDGKPAMKRLRFGESLAIGKYAFAKFDGYFDEGKHKFWGFEVRTGDKRDNGSLVRDITVNPKPKPTPTPETQPTKIPANNGTPIIKPAPTIPTGARIAYCNDSNVVVRAAPGLSARKISGLNRGQRVYVIQYSSNTDYWRGVQANWAYIQTESGKTGWVFSPFISY